METEASLARRMAKLAERIGAGDGDGIFIIPRGSGMRGVREACQRMRAIRDGTVPKPIGNGMRSFRKAVLAEKARLAERDAAEPATPAEENIIPLPRPVLPKPKPPPLYRPPPPKPAPPPKPVAKKPAATYSWEDL